jgi:hypothetical protein
MEDDQTTVPERGSAKYPLRLPRGLYEQLRGIAEQEGVSVNTLMATLLAGAVGFTLDKATKPEEVTMQHYRFQSTVNGRAFARQAGINERTFRRWLRRQGQGVGLGSEYELAAPDTTEGRRILTRFESRAIAR